VPPEVHDEDVTLVVSVLTALKALDICSSYKINQCSDSTVTVRGVLKDDVLEIDTDDMYVLLGVSPARIERVSVSRAVAGKLEIVVRIMDHTRRVMVTGISTFVAMKKRKLLV